MLICIHLVLETSAFFPLYVYLALQLPNLSYLSLIIELPNFLNLFNPLHLYLHHILIMFNPQLLLLQELIATL